MGSSSSKPSTSRSEGGAAFRFRTILDSFETLEQVQDALRQAGLESSQLILGVDFTKSNEWTGVQSFNRKCLHALDAGPNPYQQVFSTVCRTLAPFDDDQLVPCYGFGDVTTGDRKVFSFYPDDRPAHTLTGVLGRYSQIAPFVQLAGPTSFAPLIRQAMRIVVASGMQYHILMIVADGQVTPTCLRETVDAIVAASSFPLSIVLVGVGDGPWDTMQAFDDDLPARKFDNFQFVNFNKAMAQASVYSEPDKREAHLAMHVLMEIPDQYKTILKLGLMGRSAQAALVDAHEPILLPPPPQILQADQQAMQGNFGATAPGMY